MPEYDPVTKISIVPRGQAGGLTFFAPSEERLESGLYSRSYLENQMAVALGGRVAEELIFGEDQVTTGASGDFQQVNFAVFVPCSSWIVRFIRLDAQLRICSFALKIADMFCS